MKDCKINNYTLVEQIGSGAYGIVFRAKDEHDPDRSRNYAIKAVIKDTDAIDSNLSDNEKTNYLNNLLFSFFAKNNFNFFVPSLNLKNINPNHVNFKNHPYLKEIFLHMKVNHLNHVAKIHKVLNSKSIIFIVMDYYPLDLFTSIVEHKHFQDKPFLIKKVFTQLCLTVLNCHNLGLYHCDIKPENILLDEHFNIKLCDFGLSTTSKYLPSNVSIGSSYYMAPEKMNGNEHYQQFVKSELGDIWSLGIILINLTCIRNPWLKANSTTDNTFKYYTRHSNILQKILPINLEFNLLLSKILKINPIERISLIDIIYHILKIESFNNSGPLSNIPVFDSIYDFNPLDDYILPNDDEQQQYIDTSIDFDAYSTPISSPISNNDKKRDTTITSPIPSHITDNDGIIFDHYKYQKIRQKNYDHIHISPVNHAVVTGREVSLSPSPNLLLDQRNNSNLSTPSTISSSSIGSTSDSKSNFGNDLTPMTPIYNDNDFHSKRDLLTWNEFVLQNHFNINPEMI